MSSERDGDRGDESNEQMRHWREIYGDMIPERIVDTKIGEDGKRYYKVQWAASSFEPAKNFLEAEMLIRKYWDPVEKKLKLPSSKKETKNIEDGASASSSSSSQVDLSSSSVNAEQKVGEYSTSKSNNEKNSIDKKPEKNIKKLSAEENEAEKNILQKNIPENEAKTKSSTDHGKRKLIISKNNETGDDDRHDERNECKKPRTSN